MTETQRLAEIMELIHCRTRKEFAEKLKIQPSTLSGLLNGRGATSLSSRLKAHLETYLNVNLEWLEKGKGEPFHPGASPAEKAGGVPYFQAASDNMSFMEEVPEYFVNYKPFNDCSAYIPVFGDSMYPKYASGDVIAIKEISNKDIIQWGEAYVVETDHEANAMRAIKLIYEHANRNNLILRSSNPNYKGDTVIAKKNISKLYIIRGKITRLQI